MIFGLEPDAFLRRYEAGAPFVVAERLSADLVTPVAAFLKLRAAFAGPAFLLESVEGGAARGRYSMVGLAPDLVWRCEAGVASVEQRPAGAAPGIKSDPNSPLDSLRRVMAESALPLDPALPPMAAGLFGYLGYDMVRSMEALGPRKPDPLGVPDGIFVRPTLMVVFDSVRDELFLIAPVRPRAALPATAAFEAVRDRLDAAAGALESALPTAGEIANSAPADGAMRSNLGPDAYGAMVVRAKEYIAAGDIFQVVLSQRYEAPFPLPAIALYRALRRVNPAPFLCYLDFESFQVVCSSPEILVRVRRGTVTVRPIAGTRPRGETPAEDARLGAELLADEKECAEHLMLLDLGRNDVGRVSEIGSVAVTDSFFIERYSHVMHIVSNVEGRLRPDCDALDALVAGFPAGTVSGAPKIRAMEIIDELEPDGRGPYGGCIGYLGADGEMDTCIVLRTAVVKDGRMYVQAGAGIVHDSDPAAEARECANKATALFRAAEEAVRFAAEPRRGQ